MAGAAASRFLNATNFTFAPSGPSRHSDARVGEIHGIRAATPRRVRVIGTSGSHGPPITDTFLDLGWLPRASVLDPFTHADGL